MTDEASSKFASLKRTYEGLIRDVRMSDVESEINRIGESARSLPEKIKGIRERGYVFRSYLENKAEVIQNHWDDIRHRVQRAIETESEGLREELEDVEKKLEAAERVADNETKLAPRLEMLEPAVSRLEEKVKQATSKVSDIYETLQNDIMKTESQLREIEWFLEQKEEASFDFLAGESLFLAAKAEWVVTGKGKKDPDGILYLTDQRLVFEQKETTGKRLGMFGGKQEQEVEWEIPLNQFESVTSDKKGMFGGKDMLEFSLSSGAPYAKITVEVKGGVDCRFWEKQVNRMVSGEASDERAIEPDPELVEAVRNAPTDCHVCGGTLPKIVAGQNQLECMYCGAIVRL